LIQCTSSEADAIVTGAAEQIEAIAEMLSDAQGRFTHIVDTFEWSSFTPQQRALLKHWHTGCKEALHVLRNPHVL
jgi:hypothetical protein